MHAFLYSYTNPNSLTYGHWAAASMQTAIGVGCGVFCSRTLHALTYQYINDRELLSINPYGDWNESMLADEALALEIGIHLQELKDDITAKKLVKYLARPDVMVRHGITKAISIWTAHRHLKAVGYRFTKQKKGQFGDGHECSDNVHYREKKFLLKWEELQARMHKWSKENVQEEGPLHRCRVIVWWHDESIFYANDCRRNYWIHKDAEAKLHPKSEGASFMVADYVSADFGWLRSPDGRQSARHIMRPGKNKDGYMTLEDVEDQAQLAMDICSDCWPEFDHVFMYNNATMHLKQLDGSLSAQKMPKYSPKPGKPNWLVEVTKRNEQTNRPIHNENGTLMKVKIKMTNANFNGQPQPLYFPNGHPCAGTFKGMAIILEERGFDASKKLAECKGFKCQDSNANCCCRHILYNQPDFVNVEPLLEQTCKSRGFRVIFLPKFHCELNFIEQC
jgi:hypothetical protein